MIDRPSLDAMVSGQDKVIELPKENVEQASLEAAN